MIPRDRKQVCICDELEVRPSVFVSCVISQMQKEHFVLISCKLVAVSDTTGMGTDRNALLILVIPCLGNVTGNTKQSCSIMCLSKLERFQT